MTTFNIVDNGAFEAYTDNKEVTTALKNRGFHYNKLKKRFIWDYCIEHGSDVDSIRHIMIQVMTEFHENIQLDQKSLTENQIRSKVECH